MTYIYGDFWIDYKLLNEAIEDYDEIRKKKLQKVIQIITKLEFNVFYALLILASQAAKIGRRLLKKQRYYIFVTT